MPRKYRNLPDPLIEPVAFNRYLKKNNEEVTLLLNWIVHKNSYIENQLVCWHSLPFKYIWEIPADHLSELMLFLENNYPDNHIYINEDKRRSVPNRLHLHIKL